MEITFSADTPAELYNHIEKFLNHSKVNKVQEAINSAMQSVEMTPMQKCQSHPLAPLPKTEAKTLSAKEKVEAKLAAISTEKIPPTKPSIDDIFGTNNPKPPKVVTRKDLQDALQALIEKSDNQESGVIKVSKIFDQFGITKLPQLDEKRIHEMMTIVQKQLGGK